MRQIATWTHSICKSIARKMDLQSTKIGRQTTFHGPGDSGIVIPLSHAQTSLHGFNIMNPTKDALESESSVEYRIETHYLQGLPGLFTNKVDLVLTARDGSQHVGFPVHQLIIAQHSPVLCSVLDKAQLEDMYFAALSQSLPYVPMIEDNYLAICAALAFMYNPLRLRFTEASDIKANHTAAESAPPQFTIDMIPAAASQTEFAHKYGMLEFQIEQEACMLQPLEDMVASIAGSHATVDQIIDCAVAAAKFHLGALLSMCEIIILWNIEDYLHTKPMERLPSSSMLRIARYLDFDSSKSWSLHAVHGFVLEAYLRDPPASQDGSLAIIRCVWEQSTTMCKLEQILKSMKPTLQG